MINLLPTERLVQLRAARTNVLLARYIGISFLAAVTLLGVMYGSYSILAGTMSSAEGLIKTNDTQAGLYSETKKTVGDLSGKLATTKIALDQEVRFSKILTDIAAEMPEGTVIDALELQSDSLLTPLTITVNAKNTNALLALQAAFKNSSTFSNTSFQSISEKGGSGAYPASVTMTVTLRKGGL